MINFKLNCMEALKSRGYTYTYIQEQRLLSNSTLTKLRNSDTTITLDTLNRLCYLLDLEITDIIELTWDVRERDNVLHITDNDIDQQQSAPRTHARL